MDMKRSCLHGFSARVPYCLSTAASRLRALEPDASTSNNPRITPDDRLTLTGLPLMSARQFLQDRIMPAPRLT
jgi:hypothetical protein